MRVQADNPMEPWDMVIAPPKGWFDLHRCDLWCCHDGLQGERS
jgi:hypothetical protein